ncbi:hypothetical protein [Chryseosolibacter indicus]|uniref:Lipoprotein n=1 Tax=Chryseosolibacter indicus TaxID=2782351 RepID=A0ABS5VPZ0_9BACT|nr:hypothetical protein [Chryseosolibacter indicus]MBT1703088.1 hypothetical protein [Chryseosolibacter indicus]
MNVKLLLTGIAFILAVSTNAQGLVGKLKQKASQAAEKALEKKVDEKTGGNSNGGNTSNENSGNNSSGGNHPTNKGGGGLISTPPDVNQNLSDAESAYKTGSYGEARYAVQQAMLGVELEIGQKVLKSLPETVSGLKKEDSQDKVTSTGWGWAGLTIEREYNKDDMQLRTTVANNSAWMSAVNMYLANGGYAQQTNGQQNWKQTKVKGHRGVIEYDESTGYKLSVPLGQTSLIVWEAVNFATEQEMMAAANAFDIDGIKKMLGEK